MCPNCGAVIQVPDANQPVGYLQSHGHHGGPPSLHMHGGGVLLHECVLSDDWLGAPHYRAVRLGQREGDDRAVSRR